MKVMFRLSPAQVANAAQLLASVKEKNKNAPMDTETEKWYFGGNLIGWKLIGVNTNVKQKLTLSTSGNYLIYEGARHAMVKDGALDAIKIICENNLKAMRFVDYETTDENLMWFQTTEDFVKDGNEVKVLNWLGRKKTLTLREREALDTRIKNSVGLPLFAPVEYGTPAHRKLDASGMGWKMKLINHAHKLVAA